MEVQSKRQVVPFEFIYPLAKSGNFWNQVRLGFVMSRLKWFGIYLKILKLVGIKEKCYRGWHTAAVQSSA
jgi:hypothetical protein